MDEDAVSDFSSRRAMFQQMSHVASVPQPALQATILKGHKFATLGDADQKRQSFARAMSTESYTLGKPVRIPKPFALPRAKFDGVVHVNTSEGPKFNTSSSSLVNSGTALVDSPNHKLIDNIGTEYESNGNDSETAMDKQQFRHTLLLWERTSCHGTASRQFSQTSSTALDGSVYPSPSKKSDELLECSPPGWTTEYQQAGPCKYQDDKKSSDGKLPLSPSMKPLPPLELLGPRPRKPDRPPLVDLSAFFPSRIDLVETEAADHGDQFPELAEPHQDGDTYEDVLAVRAGFDSVDVSPVTGNENHEYVSLMSDKEVDSLNSKNNQNDVTEDVYYDVEYVNGGLNRMESSTFTSDSFSETSNEVYDDIQNVKDENSSNKSEKDVKLKGLRRIFKKNTAKLITKIPKSKENGITKAASLPNLKAEHPDPDSTTLYNNVGNGTVPNAVKKVDDKQKTRLPRFLLLKEGKEKRKSQEWVESEEGMYADVQTQGPPRSVLKSKGKKVEKEEKLFRERFEYTKDIEVINTAVVESSSKTGKLGKLDLPIKPGEELDIIDITDENVVICRNSGGKYGYVLLEHLNFKR